ncbi:hypothetical protein D3C81_2236770 [compost metagenome]
MKHPPVFNKSESLTEEDVFKIRNLIEGSAFPSKYIDESIFKDLEDVVFHDAFGAEENIDISYLPKEFNMVS